MRLAEGCSSVCLCVCVCVHQKESWVCVGVCVCVHQKKSWVCVCVHQKKSWVCVGVSVCASKGEWVWVCVCVHQKESECGCVCLCVHPKERVWVCIMICASWFCCGGFTLALVLPPPLTECILSVSRCVCVCHSGCNWVCVYVSQWVYLGVCVCVSQMRPKVQPTCLEGASWCVCVSVCLVGWDCVCVCVSAAAVSRVPQSRSDFAFLLFFLFLSRCFFFYRLDSHGPFFLSSWQSWQSSLSRRQSNTNNLGEVAKLSQVWIPFQISKLLAQRWTKIVSLSFFGFDVIRKESHLKLHFATLGLCCHFLLITYIFICKF